MPLTAKQAFEPGRRSADDVLVCLSSPAAKSGRCRGRAVRRPARAVDGASRPRVPGGYEIWPMAGHGPSAAEAWSGTVVSATSNCRTVWGLGARPVRSGPGARGACRPRPCSLPGAVSTCSADAARDAPPRAPPCRRISPDRPGRAAAGTPAVPASAAAACLLIVTSNTGDGKGNRPRRSESSCGGARDWRVCVIQFIKSGEFGSARRRWPRTRGRLAQRRRRLHAGILPTSRSPRPGYYGVGPAAAALSGTLLPRRPGRGHLPAQLGLARRGPGARGDPRAPRAGERRGHRPRRPG